MPTPAETVQVDSYLSTEAPGKSLLDRSHACENEVLPRAYPKLKGWPMRRTCIFFFIGTLALLFSLTASAQEFPKAEVFGGYSYLHIDTQGITTSSLNTQCTGVIGGTCPITFEIHPGFNGWNISPQVNLNQWFGVKAQIAGEYGNLLTVKFNNPPPIAIFSLPGQHIYDFLVGPVISHRTDKYTVFGHGLLGAQHIGLSGNVAVAGIAAFTTASETDFAFALGGGVDVKVSKHFAVRAGQFDYEFVNSSGGGHQNDFRFSAGVVFQLGGAK
jgi:opacity protein-like surface antigen